VSVHSREAGATPTSEHEGVCVSSQNRRARPLDIFERRARVIRTPAALAAVRRVRPPVLAVRRETRTSRPHLRQNLKTTTGGVPHGRPADREHARHAKKRARTPEEGTDMSERTWYESIKVEGGQLVDKVAQLIREGNVRRIVIKQGDRTIAEFPLTIGVVGAVFAPVLAGVGAIAALIGDCSILVERVDTAGHATPASTPAVQDPPAA
jgi:hypothetical protein